MRAPLNRLRVATRGPDLLTSEEKGTPMARYTGTVDAPHSAEAVWSYLADLRSIGEWDPSVESVKLTGGEPRTETARYQLEVSFRGRTISLPYRVVEVDRPNRVVFAAETDEV